MYIVKHRKIFYLVSTILVAGSLLAMWVWGLRLGIDFSGGSMLSVAYGDERPSSESVSKIFENTGINDVLVQTSGDGFIIRSREISVSEKESVMQALSFDGLYAPSEKGFSSVGPVLGKEAIRKSWVSIALVLVAIILFIAFSFRKVSKPVSSWVYGLISILALAHDVLVPTGVFAVLGHFYGFEVDTLFVTALLVILGFSVHDTIVVFDRVRENLHKNEEFKEGKDFETIVGESVNQTIVRSINTSLTTMLSVIVLLIVGPASVREFSLVMLIGLVAGAYSSIFVGSPLLVTINNWKKARS